MKLILLSFLLSLVLCAVEIPLLRKIGMGQNILGYVKEHESKSGTPTMGGLGFILSAVAISIAVFGVSDRLFLLSVAVGVGYLLVGFLDDFLKKARRQNEGLKPYQKILFQLIVAVMASVVCYTENRTTAYIPFTLQTVELGFWIIPLGVFVFLATVNSVNLTDGLDGLAGGTSAVFFLFSALIISRQEGDVSLIGLSYCLFGALLAFLLFNVNKASVFMGDTGSLALGGFVATSSLFSGNVLLLPILGVMFVLSSISVIMQVIYYKKTGKRIFLMSPIHHHFQQKGYSESKIAYAYALITAVMGLLLYAFL